MKDSRFDANFAMRLLLDIAHERSVEDSLQILIDRVVERPDLACIQVWLIGKGDRCSVCPKKAVCLNQTRCLHLTAGGGKLPYAANGETRAFNDPNDRMPLGIGLMGEIVETGRQLVVKHLGKNPEYVKEFDRLHLKQIRSFSGSPIIFKGEILGLTIAFALDDIPDEARPWGQIFADHLGAAIANARAFAEIQKLKAQLEQQNEYLLEEVVEAKAFGDLVGQSAALRKTINQIDLVAPTEASVLILGDTGTGKELVAHEIHRRSQRKDYPLVRVNCASIPKGLFESEFFGHVKGAFTGAIKDRPGRFETAEGGTLFLDEIGEVPLEMQSKLLRVLQEKHYERVGDDRTRQANVRIIGATNRDLKAEVTAGRFREDLYYRLSVFPINVTALKERKDDIPLLAKHFIELSVKELRCPKPKLTRAGIIQLQNYDWPGNVRELRNVIERAVILARGGPLAFDLPTKIQTPHSTQSIPLLEKNDRIGFFTEIEMRHWEMENLREVLNKADWRIKGPNGAAELIGLKPTTVLARMKKMGLKQPS